MDNIPTRDYLADRLGRWAHRQTTQNLLLAIRYAQNLDAGTYPIPSELTTTDGLCAFCKEVLR